MNNSNQTFLIYGISKGLGKPLSSGTKPTDTIYGISRTQPQQMPDLNGICTDLSKPEQATNDPKTAIKQQKPDDI